MSVLKTFIITITIIVLTPVKNYAQELLTDRPDQTEGSRTLTKGRLQVESGIQFSDWDENSIQIRQTLLPTVLFRYGLSKGFELRLVTQNENLLSGADKTTGLSDLEIGAKIQVLRNENSNTEIAFLAHVIVPTGNETLSNGKWGIVNKMAFSHAVNNTIGIGYNIGYNNFGFDNGSITYSFVAGFSLNDKISVYIEPFGEIANLESLFVNADTGITYLLRKNFQLDFSMGTGINYKTKYLAFGFSWRIPE